MKIIHRVVEGIGCNQGFPPCLFLGDFL